MLEPGANVLDVGSAHRWVIEAAAQRGSRVEGVERDLGMADFAGRHELNITSGYSSKIYPTPVRLYRECGITSITTASLSSTFPCRTTSSFPLPVLRDDWGSSGRWHACGSRGYHRRTKLFLACQFALTRFATRL